MTAEQSTSMVPDRQVTGPDDAKPFFWLHQNVRELQDKAGVERGDRRHHNPFFFSEDRAVSY